MVSTNNGGGLSAADVAAVMGNGNNGWGLGGFGGAGMMGLGMMDGMGHPGPFCSVSYRERKGIWKN